MHACVYTHLCVDMHVYEYLRKFVFMYICACVCIYIYIYIHTQYLSSIK